nr:MAG TPA: hypothetical protein [Caudoviricetes sp.]
MSFSSSPSFSNQLIISPSISVPFLSSIRQIPVQFPVYLYKFSLFPLFSRPKVV